MSVQDMAIFTREGRMRYRGEMQFFWPIMIVSAVAFFIVLFGVVLGVVSLVYLI